MELVIKSKTKVINNSRLVQMQVQRTRYMQVRCTNGSGTATDDGTESHWFIARFPDTNVKSYIVANVDKDTGSIEGILMVPDPDLVTGTSTSRQVPMYKVQLQVQIKGTVSQKITGVKSGINQQVFL